MPSQTTTPIMQTGNMIHQRTGTDLVHQCGCCGRGTTLGFACTAKAIHGILLGKPVSGAAAYIAAAYGIWGGICWLDAWPVTTPAHTMGSSSGTGSPTPEASSRQKTVK